MIVYSVDNRFAATKAEALEIATFRGLPASAVTRVSIASSDELVTFLNKLSAARADDVSIPQFLRDSWAKHMRPTKPTER